MSLLTRQPGAFPGIVLALMLVAAQSVAAMHDLRHDPATAKNQVCTTCVAASQLGAAAVDTGAPPAATDTVSVFNAVFAASLQSTHSLAPRQRGPPALF